MRIVEIERLHSFPNTHDLRRWQRDHIWIAPHEGEACRPWWPVNMVQSGRHSLDRVGKTEHVVPMENKTAREVSSSLDSCHSGYDSLSASSKQLTMLAVWIFSIEPFLIIFGNVDRTVECLSPHNVCGVVVRMGYLFRD